jgi:excinuclease UvrABC nuclease subunit
MMNLSNKTHSGIYRIRNIENNHVYIGSAKDILGRKSRHFYALKNNKHHNQHLQ